MPAVVAAHRVRGLLRVGHLLDVRVDERRVAPPVLGRSVAEHNLGRVTPFVHSAQQRAAFARDRICLLRVGEREQLRDHEADVLGRLAETHVELAPHSPRHVRDYAIQGGALLFVFVQAQVDHLPQEAPALRDTHGVGSVDAGGARVAGIGRRVLQEGHRVPHGGEAQADYCASPGAIDELVDLARLETRLHVHVGRLRLHLRVLHPDERPLVAADGRCRSVGVLPHRKRGVRVVHLHRRMGQVRPVGEQKHLGWLVGLQPAHDSARDGITSGAERSGRLQAHQPGRGRDVGLPAAPDHRVAVAHEEAVARLDGRVGIYAPVAAVESLRAPFCAPCSARRTGCGDCRAPGPSAGAWRSAPKTGRCHRRLWAQAPGRLWPRCADAAGRPRSGRHPPAAGRGRRRRTTGRRRTARGW